MLLVITPAIAESFAGIGVITNPYYQYTIISILPVITRAWWQVLLVITPAMAESFAGVGVITNPYYQYTIISILPVITRAWCLEKPLKLTP